MGEEVGSGQDDRGEGQRRLLPAFKSDKHFRVVFFLLRVFFPVWFLFFFFPRFRRVCGQNGGVALAGVIKLQAAT